MSPKIWICEALLTVMVLKLLIPYKDYSSFVNIRSGFSVITKERRPTFEINTSQVSFMLIKQFLKPRYVWGHPFYLEKTFDAMSQSVEPVSLFLGYKFPVVLSCLITIHKSILIKWLVSHVPLIP